MELKDENMDKSLGPDTEDTYSRSLHIDESVGTTEEKRETRQDEETEERGGVGAEGVEAGRAEGAEEAAVGKDDEVTGIEDQILNRMKATDVYPTADQQDILIMPESRMITMDYRAAVLGQPRQPQTQRPTAGRRGPEYIETNTFKVKPISGESRTMTQVLDEIDKMGLDDMDNVTGIQETDKRLGEYKVTFDSEDSKRRARETWRLEAAKGTVKMIPKGGEEAVETATGADTFKLEGVPVEYPTTMTEEYVKRYVTNPTVTRDTIPGRRTIYNGNLTVKYDRIREELKGRMWVGPGILAAVKRSNLRPMSQWQPQCVNCLEFGHLRMNCTLEQKCIKCRQGGHMGRDCPWCPRCRLNGHRLEDCELFKEAVRRREAREEAEKERVREEVEKKMEEERRVAEELVGEVSDDSSMDDVCMVCGKVAETETGAKCLKCRQKEDEVLRTHGQTDQVMTGEQEADEGMPIRASTPLNDTDDDNDKMQEVKKKKKKKEGVTKGEKTGQNKSVMERAKLFENRKPTSPPKRQMTKQTKPLRKTTTTKVLSHDGQTIFVKETAKRTQSKSMEDAAGDKKKPTRRHPTSQVN